MSWFDNNEGRDLDRLYGRGHRPSARRDATGSGWVPACLCSPDCRVSQDDSKRIHRNPDHATRAAAHNLETNEHGPSAGQETT